MPNPNENCLKGKRCPNAKCGSYGGFDVIGTATFNVTDDGAEAQGSIEYDGDSFAWCRQCDFSGKWFTFDDPECKEAKVGGTDARP